ncbi:Dehydroquinate synthase-like protein [Decorospora gaudefroyi]|uniref:Dehydroquinate synthase-like protein n=1 Tax=Decorospora gaudefroyi TaxID=184978 RepID=A0A6A5KDW7_9PLEO|nr:Dehydroquinate synthase-like protein [Decorospora gaudefroyi]
MPSSFYDYCSSRKKRTIQQLPIPARKGHNAILNSNYIQDIVDAIGTWGCQRILLVHSKTLDENTDVVKNLKEKLGWFVVGTKSGVDIHSPYEDVLDITKLLNEKDADCLVSIGSSSCSDACKIARLMQVTLAPDSLTVEAMENLVDEEKRLATIHNKPRVRMIAVPTGLSAGEWNNRSAATNPHTHKKQHFASEHGAPDLILCDPEVASTSPTKLWLSSGMRAIDHCIETMLSDACTQEVFHHMEDALAVLLSGLRDYNDSQTTTHDRTELVAGISTCQLGSRNAMMGLLLWRVPMGASHAIGQQLGSVCGVMHGITTCIVLAPVLSYTAAKSDTQAQRQGRVLGIWNKILGSQYTCLADAVMGFVQDLGLPTELGEVGVLDQKVLGKVAECTVRDAFGAMEGLGGKEDVLAILEKAKGGGQCGGGVNGGGVNGSGDGWLDADAPA